MALGGVNVGFVCVSNTGTACQERLENRDSQRKMCMFWGHTRTGGPTVVPGNTGRLCVHAVLIGLQAAAGDIGRRF